MKNEILRLNNGVQIPQLGLGCGGIYRPWRLFNADSRRLFCTYLKMMGRGPILLDSEATGFHEDLLGTAIRLKGGKPADTFICTKLSNRQQYDGDVIGAVKRSLKRLHVDQIDLYLMHWPVTDRFIQSYLQMEEALKQGFVRAIGVCNFHQHHLEELMQHASIVPAVDQFEIHPLFTQDALVDYVRGMGIMPMSYTPIARNHDVLFKAKILKDLARKYGRTPHQIIIRWHIQRGLLVAPKTSRLQRAKQYFEVFDFALTDEEMAGISAINDNVRLRYNPDKCDFTCL